MIAPPLRTVSDQEVLWHALETDRIQTIATDHCSFTEEQKRAGEEDFSKTPCGMPGAEERPALIYHYGVGTGRLSLEQMCRYLAEDSGKTVSSLSEKGRAGAGKRCRYCGMGSGNGLDVVERNPAVGSRILSAGRNPVEGKSTTGLFKRRADCRERTDFKGKSGDLHSALIAGNFR